MSLSGANNSVCVFLRWLIIHTGGVPLASSTLTLVYQTASWWKVMDNFRRCFHCSTVQCCWAFHNSSLDLALGIVSAALELVCHLWSGFFQRLSTSERGATQRRTNTFSWRQASPFGGGSLAELLMLLVSASQEQFSIHHINSDKKGAFSISLHHTLSSSVLVLQTIVVTCHDFVLYILHLPAKQHWKLGVK